MRMLRLFTYLRALAATAVLGLAMGAVAEELPYAITFTQSNSSTWSVIDGNGDGDNWNKKWMWSSRGFNYNLVSSAVGNSDDWAISPGFTLEGGRQYEIAYVLYGYDSAAKNMPVHIRLMTSNTQAQPQATEIASYPPPGGGTTTKYTDPYTATFTCPADGTYYIGFEVNIPYGSTDGNHGQIILDRFSIQALQKATAPGALGAVTVTPGAQGALTADFSVVMPTLDCDGEALTTPVTLFIYNEDDDTPSYTSSPVQPGSTVTASVSAMQGETYFRLVASNDAGSGAESRVDAFIGEDVPQAVETLQVTVNDAGVPVLTWQAPTVGVHAGYLNSGGIVYKITRILDGDEQEPTDVSALTFTDSSLSLSEQHNVAYTVTPVSGGGYGEKSTTGTYNVGTQLQLPFADTFPYQKHQTAPWRQEVTFNFDEASYQPEWSLSDDATVVDYVTDDNPEGIEITIAAQDRDHGMLRFNSNAVGKMKDAASGRIILPAIDMKDMLNPVLTFYMFRETYYTTNPATNGGYRDDFIRVEASAERGEFTPIAGAEFHRYGKDNAWVKCEVPLYSLCGKERVQIALHGYGFGGGPIYIDNIRIDELVAHDLQALLLAGPERVRVGETGAFRLQVKNAGGRNAEDYTVVLKKDGEQVLSVAGPLLTPGKSASVALEYTPASGEEASQAQFTAEITYGVDQDLQNNLSNSLEVAITAPLRPAPTKLKGEENDGTVTLSWAKADYLPAETLTEADSFEAYEPFTINTFGQFTSLDLDGRPTFGVGSAAGVTYPGSGDKMACQIFTPSLTNIDDEEIDMWAPHTGLNMLISPQAMAQGDVTASNDWIIFPRLSGYAHQVKFFARSLSQTYTEYMQGFYTNVSDPTDADDFLPCPDGGETSYAVPTEWKQLSYSVPANAKYFALRHNSGDGYILMIDDVSYQRSIPDADAMGLLGYNLYCDGEKVNPSPITERTFTHLPAKGTHEYKVAALYPEGESQTSEPLTLTVNGTESVDTLGSGVAFSVRGLCVEVKGTAQAALYTPAGVLVNSAFIQGEGTLQASTPGLYLLNLAGKTFKIILK